VPDRDREPLQIQTSRNKFNRSLPSLVWQAKPLKTLLVISKTKKDNSTHNVAEYSEFKQRPLRVASFAM
jgi:hypothetical protein